jgi:hypothetical protein
MFLCQVPVGCACNSSYSGGKRIEAPSQPQQILSQKYPTQKRDGGEAQGVGPEFKPQYYKAKHTFLGMYFQVLFCFNF